MLPNPMSKDGCKVRNNTCKKMVNKGKQTIAHEGEVKITRMFVGHASLDDILVPLLQIQVDNLIESLYHTTRANAVTSQANQTERDELS